MREVWCVPLAQSRSIARRGLGTPFAWLSEASWVVIVAAAGLCECRVVLVRMLQGSRVGVLC